MNIKAHDSPRMRRVVVWIGLVQSLFSGCSTAPSRQETTDASIGQSTQQLQEESRLNNLLNTALNDNAIGHSINELHYVSSQESLARIAIEALPIRLRMAAATMVTDQSLIARMVFADHNSQVTLTALPNVVDQGLLLKIALGDGFDPEVLMAAVRLLSSNEFLAIVACSKYGDYPNPWHDVASTAAEKVTDQTLLEYIAENALDSIGVTAARKIRDPKILEQVVFSSSGFHPAAADAATEVLTDEAALTRIAIHFPKRASSAVPRINDQKLLSELVRESLPHEVLLEIVSKLSDQQALKAVARKVLDVDALIRSGVRYVPYQSKRDFEIDNEFELGLNAIGRIDDERFLREIATVGGVSKEISRLKISLLSAHSTITFTVKYKTTSVGYSESAYASSSSITIFGEEVTVVLLRDQTTVAKRTWSTGFPSPLPSGSPNKIPAVVNVAQWLLELGLGKVDM